MSVCFRVSAFIHKTNYANMEGIRAWPDCNGIHAVHDVFSSCLFRSMYTINVDARKHTFISSIQFNSFLTIHFRWLLDTIIIEKPNHHREIWEEDSKNSCFTSSRARVCGAHTPKAYNYYKFTKKSCIN